MKLRYGFVPEAVTGLGLWRFLKCSTLWMGLKSGIAFVKISIFTFIGYILLLSASPYPGHHSPSFYEEVQIGLLI
jgi:hypothetical protein